MDNMSTLIETPAKITANITTLLFEHFTNKKTEIWDIGIWESLDPDSAIVVQELCAVFKGVLEVLRKQYADYYKYIEKGLVRKDKDTASAAVDNISSEENVGCSSAACHNFVCFCQN